MIASCGISIIDNRRIRQLREQFGDRFLNRCFSYDEIEYSCTKKNWSEHLGARFAAKCACFQALNWNNWRNYTQVVVFKNHLGAPGIEMKGELNRALSELNIQRISISLTHSTEYSIASVIFE
ncbi:MAG: holo-ACP synthase [Candidatus Auribacterota bacterium]